MSAKIVLKKGEGERPVVPVHRCLDEMPEADQGEVAQCEDCGRFWFAIMRGEIYVYYQWTKVRWYHYDVRGRIKRAGLMG